MSASNEEPEFPDLAPIGLAFAQAITYINYKKYPNLDADARRWLIDAGTKTMNELKRELQTLHKNKDDRTKLPPWALDPQKKLEICVSIVPHALLPYTKQFSNSLQKLLEACRLDVTHRISSGTNTIIVFYITFPEAGLRKDSGTDTTKEFSFDEDFQKKFFGAIKNIKIED